MKPFVTVVRAGASWKCRVHSHLIGILAVVVFCTTSRADDYPTIAGAVASPLLSKAEDVENSYGDDMVLLRVEMARHCLQSLSPDAADLSRTQRRILAHLDACHDSMEEILRLDGKTPDFDKIAEKAIIASPALVRKDPKTGELMSEDREAVGDLRGTVALEGLKMVANAWNASKERDNYRNRYRLVRSEAVSLADIAKKHCKGSEPVTYGVGIGCRFADGSAVVDEVFADGPAAKAGLRKGDQLVTVNGESVTMRSLLRPGINRKVYFTLRGPRDSTVKLTYSRDGATKTVELVRSRRMNIQLFDIDFDGSWNATFAHDCLAIRNTSGTDLTNCTLRVTIEGTHGDAGKRVIQHLHYVDTWPDDQIRYARYRSSRAEGIATDESVDRVQRIIIELYSDQYRGTITHEYAGTPAYDEDANRYVSLIEKNQKFLLGLRMENLFSDGGVALEHSGDFTFIPEPTVTVTLWNGDKSRKQTWSGSGQPWHPGYWSGLAFKHRSFNGIFVDQVDIEMEFPGSSKKLSYTWYYGKKKNNMRGPPLPSDRPTVFGQPLPKLKAPKSD